MALLFNGSTFTLTPFNGTAILSDVGISSLNFSGGDRPEVDITTSADSSRVSTAGLRSPRTMDIELLLSLTSTSDLAAALEGCNQVAAEVKIKPDCATAAAAYFQINGFLMSYDIAGNIDGSYTLSLRIMIDEANPSYDPGTPPA